MALPLLVDALWLMLPAYLANMLATIVGGGPPVDGGRLWRDGRRVLGDGKTWRGLVFAPLGAVAVVGVLRLIARSRPQWELDPFGPDGWWLVLAWALATGALLGDMLFSFFKRRAGRPPGSRWLGPDQLDFVLGSWVCGLGAATVLDASGATATNWFLDAWSAPAMLIAALLTPALHLVVNVVGFKLRVKEVPW